MFKNRMVSTALFCALFLFPHLSVAQDIESEEISEQSLMVVTANRKEQKISQVISDFSVINRSDIDSIQAVDALDVIKFQPGIDISRSGGLGTTASVFMRGANSDQVLVLVDGVNVASNITGSYAWENLPASQIERIEIIRGPKASLYGSDAIGGVIQIFTRAPKNFEASYEAGSFNTHHFSLSDSLSHSRGHFSAVFGSLKTDGFSASNDNNFFFNPDSDGYENLSINLNGSYQLAKGQASRGLLTFSYLQTRGDVDFDEGNSDSQDQVVSVGFQQNMTPYWRQSVRLNHNRSKLQTKVFTSIFESDRTELNWLWNRSATAQMHNEWSFGVSVNNEQALIPLVETDGSGTFVDSSRNNFALFAQWQRAINNNQISLSSRFDDNDAYSNSVTGDVAWAYQLNTAHKFKFRLGTAFKAPNFSELFTQAVGNATFFGNPNLKPEESQSFELGYRFQQGSHEFSSTIFHTQIDDLIEFSFNSDFTQGTYFNVNKAEISGLEAGYQWQKEGWQLATNTTWQNPVRKDADVSQRLLRRPKLKWNGLVSRRFAQLTVGAQVQYASKRSDFTAQLDSYTTLDATAQWRFNKQWQLGLKLSNVANSSYQLAQGFNTTPQSASVRLIWRK